jgi:hypothetical protein
MPELNRRESIAALAAVGAIAIPTVAQDDKSKDPKPAPKHDEQADRRRVIAAGMTEDEAECWSAVADAAGKFFKLPKLHPMDDHEVAHAIHVVQHKLLSRPTYRKYLELAKAETKK